jgi:hypothetical protein
MCDININGKFTNCEWQLIAFWTIMIKGDLVEKQRYQCKYCKCIKVE